MRSKDRISDAIVLFCISMLSAGCATVHLDISPLEKPISMTDSVGRPYTIIGQFNHEQKAYFVLLGFFKISNPDFSDVMKADLEEVHGDAIINTTVEVEYDFVDTFVPWGVAAAGWAVLGPVGLNLSYAFTTQTYRIKGDIVRYSK
jgi:hypothetical protein